MHCCPRLYLGNFSGGHCSFNSVRQSSKYNVYAQPTSVHRPQYVVVTYILHQSEADDDNVSPAAAYA